MKKAFITGINGQDGSYLTEHLLKSGYEVAGLVRRSSVSENQTYRINHLEDKIKTYYGDLIDKSSIANAFKDFKPDLIFNLAAQSHVRLSFDMPAFTAQVNAIGALNVFDSVKDICPDAKVYQARSSEMFGSSVDEDNFQRETTPMTPVSPYGCSKLYAYSIARNFRKAYGLFISNGILFNHESPRRNINFVSRKITKNLSLIIKGKIKKVILGNINSKRDWGHAKDYVYMQWLMLQQEKPEDFVIASGQTTTVREFIEICARKLGWDMRSKDKAIIWEGSGINEIGRRADTGDIVIRIDPRYFRPTEVDELLGDASKAREKLGWEPKILIEELISEMIDEDSKESKKESLLKNEGFSVYSFKE